MKVSVLTITYNQEKYIAQAIDSILMQQVNFDYEIVIGEDASTDRTREIVLEYARKHPDKIRALLRETAAAERDRARGLGGKTNFVQTFQACRGEYIALLDGDDYWTDPNKLQKQLDFLERHPECSICFHDAIASYEDGSSPDHKMCPGDQAEISTFDDLLKGNVVPTCSALFRKMFDQLPAWFLETLAGDWLVHLLHAEHGKLGYINGVMATYRVHQKGFWSQQDYLTSLEREMKIFEDFKKHFGSEHRDAISQEISERFLRLAGEFTTRGDLGKARTFALRGLGERLRSGRPPSRNLSSTMLRLYLPSLHKALRNLKRNS